MTYNRAQAIARANASRTYPRGMCYKWTREQFGIPSIGDRDGDGDADAVDGWKAARRRHPGDRHPPPGVPVFWSGGSNGHGHAAITKPAGVRSIDANGFGNVGTVDLGWFERNWGLTYLGWSEDLGGVPIPLGPVPDDWNHAQHLTPYRDGNGRAGILKAAKRHGNAKAIDLDFQRSRDGIWVNIHGAIPGREGFRYTAASVRAGVPKWKQGRLVSRRVSALTWAVLRTLRTRDGQGLLNGGQALALCAKHGVRVEAEPKFTPTQAQLDRLARHARKLNGANWRNRVQLKRLTTIPGWQLTVARAHQAGFIPFVLRVDNPANVPHYAHYRK